METRFENDLPPTLIHRMILVRLREGPPTEQVSIARSQPSNT
jgi:hypothetical protein